MIHPTRRFVLTAAAALAVPAPASASSNPARVTALIRDFAGGAVVTQGKIALDLPVLVENGNAVPVTVRVDSPMSATDRVQEIIVFNERNPQRDVLRASFGRSSGRAEVSTRIRLATSQQLVALARLADGSQWSHRVDVIVTLAACIES